MELIVKKTHGRDDVKGRKMKNKTTKIKKKEQRWEIKMDKTKTNSAYHQERNSIEINIKYTHYLQAACTSHEIL